MFKKLLTKILDPIFGDEHEVRCPNCKAYFYTTKQSGKHKCDICDLKYVYEN